jgi:hypothetical protein
LQDVLLTPRELLAGHAGSVQTACVEGGFCVAGSTTPASIDMVWPIQDETDNFAELTQPLFGLRCVWEVQ